MHRKRASTARCLRNLSSLRDLPSLGSSAALGLALWVAMGLGCGGVAQAQIRNPDSIARALGDRISIETAEFDRSSVDWGVGTAVVNAPAGTVMQVIKDYARYHEFMPRFRQSKVLSRRGASAMIYLEARVLRNTTTLWAQMRVKAKRPVGSTQIIEAKMVQGNMDHFLARWEVTPLSDGRRSVVRFRILVEPTFPLPSSVFTNENEKAARKTLKALRERLQLPQFAATKKSG